MKRINYIFITVLFVMLSAITASSKPHIYAANRDAGKYIALTFDDGPHPVYTEQILDILDKNGAKATFFVVGRNAESYPELIQREYKGGHEIGNHSWNHRQLTNLSDEEIKDQIMMTRAKIYDVAGVDCRIVRPPYGA